MSKQLFFSLLFVTVITILLLACNVNKSSNLPEKVILVPNSGERSIEETGIDAVPEKNGIFLQWNKSSDQITVGYRIYRAADQKNNFQIIGTVTDTFFTDENVGFYIRYYYFVTGISSNDEEGISSDTLSYKLLKKAQCINPKDNSSPVPEFQWQDPNNEDINLLRVINAETEEYVWIYALEHNYDNFKKVVFNVDGKAGIDSLIKNKTYMWRVDVLGSSDNSGSESFWNSFKIQ